MKNNKLLIEAAYTAMYESSNTPSDVEVVNGGFQDKVKQNFQKECENAENIIKLREQVEAFDFRKDAGVEDMFYGELIVFDKFSFNKNYTKLEIEYSLYYNTSDYDIEIDQAAGLVRFSV